MGCKPTKAGPRRREPGQDLTRAPTSDVSCIGIAANDMRPIIVNTEFGDLGRYAEPSLLILVSLSNGPKHGYAIMEDSETIAGRRIGAGTLYGALARLERLGMIEPVANDNTRRRPYRLTALGATTLKAQLERLHDLSTTGLARLDGAAR